MDYFYHAESDQTLTVRHNVFGEPGQNSDPSIFLKVSSVLFIRAGLFLSHVSSVPSSNIQILIFQNIIDIAVNTVIYALIGYLFAFGNDVGSFIGIDGFLQDKSNKDEFAEGWIIIIAVSGLLVAAIGDRISFFASLLINALASGFVFPVIIHWILSDKGWMRVHALTKVNVSYKDYSYSCMVHMAGGFLASISMLVLNKRLLRFKDMDVCSIPDNGPSLTLFGNFFMLIGFFGIAVPSEKFIIRHLGYNFYGIVIVNMLLSAFGSITSTLLLTFAFPCEPMHKWTSMRSIQAGISGIAVIAGGADVYYPLASLLLGIFNGILFFFVSYLVNASPIEDYSNIIACHFVSGFLGTLLPPVFGIREGFSASAYYNFIHFVWQLLCDLAVLGFIVAIFLPVIFLLDYCCILRSWDEDINHRRAINASKSMRSGRGVIDFAESQKTETTVNIISDTYNSIAESTQMKAPEEPKEPSSMEGVVNILYEKKPSRPIETTEEREITSVQNFVPTCSSSEKTNENFKAFPARNEKLFAHHRVDKKPMRLIEKINPYLKQADGCLVSNRGEDIWDSKLFELRLLKEIRNISDSGIFQNIRPKDRWVIPKRKSTWTRERELKLGSASNIFTQNLGGTSVETQV